VHNSEPPGPPQPPGPPGPPGSPEPSGPFGRAVRAIWPGAGRLSRRGATLVVAGTGVIVALALAVVLSVPYVALTPGPTLNTLGKLSGKPLIQISGHRTYSTSGNLNLVTVSFIGGPQSNFNVFAALRSWLTPHDAVVPQEEIFPPGQTQRQVQQQDTLQMVNSQQTATAAALCQLKIPFKTIDTIQTTQPGKPAAGVLRKGDVITAVDGSPVTCRHNAADMIRQRKPGAPVTLTIQRHGTSQRIRLRTVQVDGTAVVGVTVGESFQFPFKIKISIGNIGGPSAGMMFALGIIDKLTNDNLTGGKFIAGTGEIEANGNVDPIGGIQQKMAGARAAGATVFLAPATNCRDTAGAVPAGMRLIRVSTLSDAIHDLTALKQGRPVPSC
jgi:Lon-like protease